MKKIFNDTIVYDEEQKEEQKEEKEDNEEQEKPVKSIIYKNDKEDDEKNDEEKEEKQSKKTNASYENLLNRIRSIEDNIYNASDDVNNKEENKEVIQKHIGNYLLNGAISPTIEKYIGISGDNSISAYSHEIMNKASEEYRLLLNFNNYFLAENDLLNVCFFSTENDDQKAKHLIETQANTADIVNPNINNMEAKPAIINYYVDFLNTAINSKNFQQSIIGHLLNQIIKKENDLILNGTGQDGQPLGIMTYLNAENERRSELNLGAWNSDQSIVNVLCSAIEKIYRSGEEYQLWMNYSTYTVILNLVKLFPKILKDYLGNVTIKIIDSINNDDYHQIIAIKNKQIHVGIQQLKLYSSDDKRHSLTSFGVSEYFAMLFENNKKNPIAHMLKLKKK